MTTTMLMYDGLTQSTPFNLQDKSSIKCHGHGHGHGHSAPSINTDDPSPPAHQRHPPSHQQRGFNRHPPK
eukprot:scaffold9761_cov85-Alexandrium_tamarense.AAC.3